MPRCRSWSGRRRCAPPGSRPPPSSCGATSSTFWHERNPMLLKRIVIPQIVLHHYQPKFESSNLDLGVKMFQLQQPWIYPVKLFAASSSSADSTFQLAYRKKASAGWWTKKLGSSVFIFFVHSFWSKCQYLTIIQPFWIFSGSNFIDEWGQRSLISYLAEIWLLTE